MQPRIGLGAFRYWAFRAGIAFSLGLIFLPVAVTLMSALLGLLCTDEFGETRIPVRN